MERITLSVPCAVHRRVALLHGDAKRDERRLLTVDGVADGAAVKHVSLHDADAVAQGAELVGGAHERGHVVTAGQRALHEQTPRAAGGSEDDDFHEPMVPAVDACGPPAVVARPGGASRRGAAAAAQDPRVALESWASTCAGRIVLVTGASIGIGREIALQFAAAGCRLALTYFEHRAEAEEVAERCRGLGSPDVITASLQLADDDSIRTLLETVDRPLRRRRHPRQQRRGHRLAAVPRAGLRRDREPAGRQPHGRDEAHLGLPAAGRATP